MRSISFVKPFFFAAVLALALVAANLTPQNAYAEGSNQLTGQGQVVAKGEHDFTLKSGDNQKKFVVTTNTQFFRDGKPASFADLKVGANVGVLYLVYGPYNVALKVTLPSTPTPPPCLETGQYTLKGLVAAKGASNFVLKYGTTQLTMVVNPQTSFSLGGKPVSFADLKVGMNVEVVFKKTAYCDFLALRVSMPAPQPEPCTISTPAGVTGIVVAKGEHEFTLKSGNSQGTIKVTDGTKFYQNGKPASFANLKPGMQVGVQVQLGTDCKYMALYVSMPGAST